MHICIFEDEFYKKLLPLAHLHPVYDLRCGITLLREKITQSYSKAELILHVRDYLSRVVEEEHPNISVNKIPTGVKEALFINGRLLMSDKVKKNIGEEYPGKDIAYLKNEVIVAAWLSDEHLQWMNSFFKDRVLVSGCFEPMDEEELSDAQLITFPWELIHQNGAQLISDFNIVTDGKPQVLGRVHEGAHLLNPSQIHIAGGAKVNPGVVLDAEEGPIYISKDVNIMPNAVIRGPAFVGENSVVKISSKIYENTTVGETCKVGGEVEESIIHAHSNKQHEGFLGHSYLGEWVNIGADSNSSDLKNDYGSVKVYNDGALVDTGSQFVGLIMGDHSKCGINSMFNTGTVVSVFCNLFGAGTPPKYVPAFAWGGADGLVAYKIEKAIEVARKVMSRRKIELSSGEEQLFKTVFNMTMGERADGGVKNRGD
jgi:UDP-N-acetylglucosamine diphosphorylase/glucosamine-1-phosphate N-acetyltransferase